MKQLIATLFLLITVLTNSTNGQSTNRIRIWVSLSGDDTIGQGIAYAVREELRRSSIYEVATSETGMFQVRIISIDAGDNEGNMSAIAVSYTMFNYLPLDEGDPQTWYPIYLTTEVLLVGRNRIEQQAKSIVATLDQSIEIFKSQINK